MFSSAEWSKQDFINWTAHVSRARGQSVKNQDDFIISQVKRFDPQLAEKLTAYSTVVDDLVTHIRSRLEPKG